MKSKSEQLIWTLLRLSLGWTFFWAFIDKVFGLGFSTKAAASWSHGISPTAHFLNKGITGPFSTLFHPFAGNPLVDWLFMLGLGGIGLSLLLGVTVRFASICGLLFITLMWLAVFPPQQNPFLDEHIIYFIIFLGLIVVDAGQWYSMRSILKFNSKLLQ